MSVNRIMINDIIRIQHTMKNTFINTFNRCKYKLRNYIQ